MWVYTKSSHVMCMNFSIYSSPDIPDYKVSTGLHGYDNLDKQMQVM